MLVIKVGTRNGTLMLFWCVCVHAYLLHGTLQCPTWAPLVRAGWTRPWLIQSPCNSLRGAHWVLKTDDEAIMKIVGN